MLGDILMFLAGLAIVGILFGISNAKRGNKEPDKERLRGQK